MIFLLTRRIWWEGLGLLDPQTKWGFYGLNGYVVSSNPVWEFLGFNTFHPQIHPPKSVSYASLDKPDIHLFRGIRIALVVPLDLGFTARLWNIYWYTLVQNHWTLIFSTWVLICWLSFTLIVFLLVTWGYPTICFHPYMGCQKLFCKKTNVLTWYFIRFK